jgi:hypothetical protein
MVNEAKPHFLPLGKPMSLGLRLYDSEFCVYCLKLSRPVYFFVVERSAGKWVIF